MPGFAYACVATTPVPPVESPNSHVYETIVPSGSTEADASNVAEAPGFTRNGLAVSIIAALSVAANKVGETGPALFYVNRSGGSTGAVSVHYATANGSATAPADYATQSGTLTFSPGDTSKQILVQVNGDTADEADETFFVNLSNPTNASIADNQGLGTIIDDDDPPTVSFNAATSSGSESTTTVSLPVSLAAASGRIVTVDYAVTGGSATGGSRPTKLNEVLRP